MNKDLSNKHIDDVMTVEDYYKACVTKLKIFKLYDYFELVLNGNDFICKSFKYGCENKVIRLPYGINILADGCFSGTDIEEIYLTSSIKIVGYACFANCTSLKVIHIPENLLQFVDKFTYCNNARIEIFTTRRKTK